MMNTAQRLMYAILAGWVGVKNPKPAWYKGLGDRV